MHISTERLLIRNFTEDDWKDLYEYLSLPETYIYEPGKPITIEESKKMCIDRANGNSFFAVELKSSGKMIGHIYFEHIIPKEYMTWELGYIFNPIFQKKGYCTEAAAKLVEFAFKEFHAHRITAYCNPDNIASWKVLEKIGMKKEGYFSKKAFFRRNDDGSPIWHDCIAYGLLNE